MIDLTPSNAKNVEGEQYHKVLMLGTAGAGKTTQLLTLPRPAFIYVFDPNALESLKGHDIDFRTFLPDKVPMHASSLAKGKGDRPSTKEFGSEVYKRFEEHAETALDTGFFDNYQTIAFDSMTTLLDLIMDRILTINGRPGEWPNQDDYGPQMNTFANICRRFTSQAKVLYFTGHVEMRQDDISKKVTWQPLMTGRLKVKIPLLFTDTFMAIADTSRDGETSYNIQTRPTREFPLCRTSIKDVKFMENMTLDFSEPLDQQGLGALLKRGVEKKEVSSK